MSFAGSSRKDWAEAAWKHWRASISRCPILRRLCEGCHSTALSRLGFSLSVHFSGRVPHPSPPLRRVGFHGPLPLGIFTERSLLGPGAPTFAAFAKGGIPRPSPTWDFHLTFTSHSRV